MASTTKIATCNYCGTRAALVLSGRERHELACSACGAPLHDLKIMPAGKGRKKDRGEYGISHKAEPKHHHPSKYQKKHEKFERKRRKKSRMRGFLSEAFDLLEDILD